MTSLCAMQASSTASASRPALVIRSPRSRAASQAHQFLDSAQLLSVVRQLPKALLLAASSQPLIVGWTVKALVSRPPRCTCQPASTFMVRTARQPTTTIIWFIMFWVSPQAVTTRLGSSLVVSTGSSMRLAPRTSGVNTARQSAALVFRPLLPSL